MRQIQMTRALHGWDAINGRLSLSASSGYSEVLMPFTAFTDVLLPRSGRGGESLEDRQLECRSRIRELAA